MLGDVAAAAAAASAASAASAAAVAAAAAAATLESENANECLASACRLEGSRWFLVLLKDSPEGSNISCVKRQHCARGPRTFSWQVRNQSSMESRSYLRVASRKLM